MTEMNEHITTVILAGGRGRRLAPYTTNFPKPLMPVGDRPILEILLERLRGEGLTDVIIATGHLEELIRAYFGEGDRRGFTIAYSREHKPLGTAGPLDLVRDVLTDPFLLVNGDTLSDIRYRELIRYHSDNGSTATVALSRRKVFIDFGVVEIDEHSRIVGWKEKPSVDYLVSTGIYVFSRKALSLLPRGESVDLPDFLLRLRSAGRLVSAYVHDGYWLDIGRPEDYEKACRDLQELV